MQQDPQEVPPIFRIKVSPQGKAPPPAEQAFTSLAPLLERLAVAQERQNGLLEELIQQMNAAQKQRASELGQWKQANPSLSRRCRKAAEALSRVQTRFLENLTLEINENEECLLDGEFVFSEFVDRYGPRLAHLNSVLHILSQLSSVNNPTNSTP